MINNNYRVNNFALGSGNLNNKNLKNSDKNFDNYISSKDSYIDRNVNKKYITDISMSNDENVVIKSLVVGEVKGHNTSIIANGGSVAYSDNFSNENPIMIVRGKDDKGYFEAHININNIDVTNCTFIEMEALNGYYIGEAMKNNTFSAEMSLFLPVDSIYSKGGNHKSENFKFNLYNELINYKNKMSSLSRENYLLGIKALEFLDKFRKV